MPGKKLVDKNKFYEVKAEIEGKLKTKSGFSLEIFLLYCGKYFFVYFYYRTDLIFYWFIGGVFLLKILPSLLVK
jgi:cellulose synthase/poly-beta-1,6-N-acetylglucosamine synthase-like glycosyltransferase